MILISEALKPYFRLLTCDKIMQLSFRVSDCSIRISQFFARHWVGLSPLPMHYSDNFY